MVLRVLAPTTILGDIKIGLAGKVTNQYLQVILNVIIIIEFRVQADYQA